MQTVEEIIGMFEVGTTVEFDYTNKYGGHNHFSGIVWRRWHQNAKKPFFILLLFVDTDDEIKLTFLFSRVANAKIIAVKPTKKKYKQGYKRSKKAYASQPTRELNI